MEPVNYVGLGFLDNASVNVGGRFICGKEDNLEGIALSLETAIALITPNFHVLCWLFLGFQPFPYVTTVAGLEGMLPVISFCLSDLGFPLCLCHRYVVEGFR